jgi:OmcA/MtrC family decaheme c-type cytochrome
MHPSRPLVIPGLLVTGLLIALAGCTGKDGNSCAVRQNGDGSATITCADGTTATVPSGSDGASCTVVDNGDGTKTIACEDGTTVTVADGSNGTSCTVSDNGNGTKTIRCADGTTVTVADGGVVPPGARVKTTDLHGTAAVVALAAPGTSPALATITGVSAAVDGTLAVTFSVARPSGAPVLDLASVSGSVARLAPGTGNAAEQELTRWVSYVQRLRTVDGVDFPNPAGTAAWQAWREGGGALSNLGGGAYRYTFATNLATAQADGALVGYERDRPHRVTILLEAPFAPAADAYLDFVPDGSASTATRDLVRTDACLACHGPDFQAHGGAVRSLEVCATCHAAGSVDPHGGASLDLKVMIHKIHAGGELPSVAGPDANPWATADNGSYAIWDGEGARHEWWKVGFPAVLENCQKCHAGGAAEADAWKTRPSRAACGSCHDGVDFASPATTHLGGPQASDANCTLCHGPDTGLSPVSRAHDWLSTSPSDPRFDARNVPEFTFDVTLTVPANGSFYVAGEAPVVSLVVRRDGTPLPDHRIVSGTAQGCKHTVSTVLCDPDTDGRFANAGFFVHGPRARQVPVLTTAARAQILSGGPGPFDLSAPGATLALKVDQGAAVVLPDAWGTRLAGSVAVPVSSGTWSNVAAAAPAEIAAWLNASPAFAARAIAFVEAGRVGLRSRNLGPVAGLQLQASAVATAVFAGDLTVKLPLGSTPSNQLTSTTDAKVTRFADHIEYALDPVTDLVPGTYVVGLEVAQLGRVSATDYRTPSVAKVPFQVKVAAPEPPVADGCAACHQDASGRGAILDASRHNKILDDTALDQCGACHDQQPQLAADATGNGGWTGARPISKRVHAIHFGASLRYPLRTVDYANGDPVVGRNWDIAFPMEVRRCEACHSVATSGSWKRAPSRLTCGGCHDADAATVHLRLMTDDPTPLDPWSGDEQESCAACH